MEVERVAKSTVDAETLDSRAVSLAARARLSVSFGVRVGEVWAWGCCKRRADISSPILVNSA